MDDHNELMRLRAEKAAALRADGVRPYANDFRVSHSLAEVVALADGLDDEELAARDGDRYSVAGRVVAAG